MQDSKKGKLRSAWEWFRNLKKWTHWDLRKRLAKETARAKAAEFMLAETAATLNQNRQLLEKAEAQIRANTEALALAADRLEKKELLAATLKGTIGGYQEAAALAVLDLGGLGGAGKKKRQFPFLVKAAVRKLRPLLMASNRTLSAPEFATVKEMLDTETADE
jgi:hypothetical protein